MPLLQPPSSILVFKNPISFQMTKPAQQFCLFEYPVSLKNISVYWRTMLALVLQYFRETCCRFCCKILWWYSVAYKGHFKYKLLQSVFSFRYCFHGRATVCRELCKLVKIAKHVLANNSSIFIFECNCIAPLMATAVMQEQLVCTTGPHACNVLAKHSCSHLFVRWVSFLRMNCCSSLSRCYGTIRHVSFCYPIELCSIVSVYSPTSTILIMSLLSFISIKYSSSATALMVRRWPQTNTDTYMVSVCHWYTAVTHCHLSVLGVCVCVCSSCSCF